MHFQPCTLNDLDEIFRLYEQAIDFQKTKTSNVWLGFSREMVINEIKERRKWKIVMGNKVACVFTTIFSDPIIWKEKNVDPSIYIHRISTNAEFRGQGFVKAIVNWCKANAPETGIKYIRLDTAANNPGLVNYYQKCGFTYLGDTYVDESDDLPAHYQNASFALFEIKL